MGDVFRPRSQLLFNSKYTQRWMEEGSLMVSSEQPMFMGQQVGGAGGEPSIKQSSIRDNISVR